MPLPPPPTHLRPRTAAVQRSDRPPTSHVVDHFGRLPVDLLRSQVRFEAEHGDWQHWARRYARTLGFVRFALSLTADACSRCILRVEERDAHGDWDETKEPRLQRVFDAYRNPLQDAVELVRGHAWHYGTVGEMVQVFEDALDGSGVDWSIYSVAACEWKRDHVVIRDVPGGSVRDGTARIVARSHVRRFWNPDEEWRGLATSPMSAGIDDLHRYVTLAKAVTRIAGSRLVMNGLLWTPSEAHERNRFGDDPAGGDNLPGSQLERQFYRLAKETIDDDDGGVAAAAPFMVHWDKEGGPPEMVEIGRDLDPELLTHMDAALMSWARSQPIPNDIIVGGGTASESNHWSAWLSDERAFTNAFGPLMDRITHRDLTATFLPPVLALFRLPRDRFRVGYDPSPVIVRPDKSDLAVRLWLAGLLQGETVLESAGFDPDRMMGPEELARVLEVLSSGASTETATSLESVTRAPVGPANVVKAPPQAPTQPRAAAALNPKGTGAMVYLPVYAPERVAVEGGEPADALHLTLFHLADDVTELESGLRGRIVEALRGAAPTMRPPEIDLTHVERFTASDDDGMEPVVLVSDTPGVYEIRERLRVALKRAGVDFSDDHAFRAHVTLGYWPAGEGPPAGPIEEPYRWIPKAVALKWGTEDEPVPFGETQRAAAATNDDQQVVTLLDRLARRRAAFGRELLAAGRLAYAQALRRAESKIRNRAQRRSAAAKQAVVVLDEGGSTAPLLAALGLDEQELLHQAFALYGDQAAQMIAAYDGDVRALLDGAGLSASDVWPDSEDRNAAALGYLVAGFEASAAQRLGTAPLDPSEIPESLNLLAPASIVAAAVAVASGRARATLPGEFGDAPELVPVEEPGLEEQIVGRLAPGRPLVWQWVHGFYGQPDQAFPPHAALDGHQTLEPDNLAFHPGDHRGCSCSWTAVALGEEGTRMVPGRALIEDGGLPPSEVWPADPAQPVAPVAQPVAASATDFD